MNTRILYLIASIPLFALCKGGDDRSLSYHFNGPATVWEETFPLGNGRIGVMPDGGIDHETYVLNESSTWSGSVQDTDNPEAYGYLEEIRSLLFQGRNDEAQDLVYKTFTCAGVGSNEGKSYAKPYGSYQIFSNLEIDYDMTGEVEGYRRELDLGSAMATVAYTQGGTDYRRDVIASYDNDVVAIRLTSGRKGALGFTLGMSRDSKGLVKPEWEPSAGTDAATGDLVFRGRLQSGTENGDEAEPQGMKLLGKTRVLLPKDGRMEQSDGKIRVSDATEAIILTALKTDYYNDDYEAAVDRALAIASSMSWKKLLASHKTAFASLFDRVDLDFGRNPEREALPMDERLQAFDQDGNDPSLVSLYYQFGRYLLISSTRPGCLPPNLQGLWANSIATPWNGDYHMNINIQMNLWPAESGNLSELHMPLVNWIEEQVESGRNTAKVFYNSRGWVTHVIGNVWQFTAPSEGPSWGATNTSAAWLCQHLYRHWQYSNDREYLERVYPVMKEAALFFVDMLVEDPRSHYLVTAPTTSPENAYRFAPGKKANISAGSTMDNQIIRELFTNVTEAAGILGVDAEFCQTLDRMRERLMPTTVAADGRIMEWLEPYEEVEVHHRHVSHLYGLYPGDEITLDGTPELAQAAIRTLETRGDQSTGWSMAWKINFWARLHDGEHAFKLVRDLLHPCTVTGGKMSSRGGGTYPNLFCAHPPFQIDGNFGGSAGIAEMLLQSHDGVIELLPAIPSALGNGSFSGLCARGGAEVSAAWKNGKVTSVTLLSKTGGDYEIKGISNGPVHLKKGEKVTFTPGI